jgi:negative regulator of replication initiation
MHCPLLLIHLYRYLLSRTSPMGTVPQPIVDSLNKLAGDSDTLTAAYGDQAAKVQAEAEATHARELADNAVASGVTSLEADKDSLKKLIDASFPSTPPAPATPPPPPPADSPPPATPPTT